MNILHALLGEHGPLRHQLDALRLVAPGLDDGQLRAATRGLAEAIESHAELEDELLFDPLSANRRMPSGPVDAMRAEHREIETLLGQVLAPPATPGRPDPQRTVARLVELVRHHFDHEENVLFPIAAALLDEERLAELGATWAGRRGIEMRTASPIVSPAVAPAATPVDDLASSTVGDIARRSPASIRVFQRHRIDFCCGGKKTVTAAATSAGVEPASLLRELRTAISSPKTGEAWLCALPDSPSELSKAIVGRYHVALRGELPRLAAMADRVVEAHGQAMPQTLPPIAREVRALSEELRNHMREEEEILFPAIARLEAATAAQPASPADLETLLAAREHEHAVAGERLAVLRRLTQGFQPPEWACNTFRALYHGLAELERELHEHIHLENNVLFPRALAQAATSREMAVAER